MNYRKGIRTNKKMICSAILYMRVYYMFMYICNLYNKVLNVTFPMCVAQMLIYYFIFIFFLNIPSMLPNYFENQCKLYISGSVHNNHTQTISKQWNMIFFFIILTIRLNVKFTLFLRKCPFLSTIFFFHFLAIYFNIIIFHFFSFNFLVE